jgi:glycosyltransferase 2 family protein
LSNTSPLPPAAKASRFPWLPVLGISLILFLLFRLVQDPPSFDWQRVGSILSNLHPGFCFLAMLLILLSYFGRAVRWEIMIRPMQKAGVPRLSLWRLFVAQAIGFTSVVLLGRPGEFVRPWLIAREAKLSFSSQVAVWFFERIYDLLIVILFFGYGLIHLSRQTALSSAGPEIRFVLASGGTVALSIGVICLGLIFGLRFLNSAQRSGLADLAKRLPSSIALRFRGLIENFLEGAAASCDSHLQWLVFFYTLIEWIIIAGCTWSIFQAFEVSRSLAIADILAFVGLVTFGAIVQLPGIGGGYQVASVAVLTQIFGFRLEDASTVTLVLWLGNFTTILPIGITLAFREGLSFAKMKQLNESTQ